jgi:NADH-quinone oxidoreductase subunit K
MLIFIFLALFLFIVSCFGIFLSKQHIIIILISFEILLLSINIVFVVSSIFLDDLVGQLYGLFTLTIAAAETAIGLALLVVYYRLRGGIAV